MDQSVLRTRIQHAKHQLTVAERELEDALRAIRATSRADKTYVGERIERAFNMLKDAKQDVMDLEALLVPEPGEF